MVEPSTTPAPAEARAELDRLEAKVRVGGRIFYTVIPLLIALVIGVAQWVSPAGSGSWILVAVFASWAAISLVGFHPALPNRWGGQVTHERIAFLKGVLSRNE